jgi:hypothetical protein
MFEKLELGRSGCGNDTCKTVVLDCFANGIRGIVCRRFSK